MLRNKEVRILMIGMFCLTAIAVAAGFVISPVTGFFTIVICLLFLTAVFIFSKWRYREIERLSTYVRKISDGEINLDVRDNQEGELSILRNEIFKVTTMLKEQGAYLNRDKIHLMEAISDISHQLKTPLTSMKMMADLLNDDTLPDDKRSEFTHTIRKQLERIEWLVSSLLKLSKIDAGTAKFKSESISAAEVTQKALEILAVPVDVKGLLISIDGDESARFAGDFNWTVEALVNILKNAMEHTPEQGEIKINFAENALFTEIVIQDSGKGISKADLPYIFKRFYKGSESGDASVGIGLAMAYSIIAEQSGNIKAESDGESGTIFTIKIYK